MPTGKEAEDKHYFSLRRCATFFYSWHILWKVSLLSSSFLQPGDSRHSVVVAKDLSNDHQGIKACSPVFKLRGLLSLLVWFLFDKWIKYNSTLVVKEILIRDREWPPEEPTSGPEGHIICLLKKRVHAFDAFEDFEILFIRILSGSSKKICTRPKFHDIRFQFLL